MEYPALEYKFLDDGSERERTVHAEDVVNAIKGGRSVAIENAVIEEPFILTSANVEGDVTILRTTFKGPVDCSYADFKRVLNLKNSIFETDATFAEVTLEKDIFLDNATFLGGAEFSNITATGVFYSRLTKFKKKATFREAAFKNIKFNKSTFEDEADFGSAQIGGNAEFVGVRFKKRANFNGIHIQGHTFFGSYYLFSWNKIRGDDDEKLRESLKQHLGFDWVKSANIEKSDDDKTIKVSNEKNYVSLKLNDKKTEVTVKYDSETTELIARWDKNELKIYLPPVTFEDEADFMGGEIGGSAEFIGAKFGQKANFSFAQIEGHSRFDQATFVSDTDFRWARFEKFAIFDQAIFEGRADFGFASIGGVAQFNEAKFEQNASFNSAHIEGPVFFNLATFIDKVDFGSAQIGGNAEFVGVRSKKNANFNSAHIEGNTFFKSDYLFTWDDERENDNEGLIKLLSREYGIDADNKDIIKKDNTITVSHGDKTVLLTLKKDELKKDEVELEINGIRTEFIAKNDYGKINIYNPATFEGEVNFVKAQIVGNAEFNEAKFKKKASFNSAQIEGHAFFKSAIFKDNGDFRDIKIIGEAEFIGAEFRQPVSFYGAQIEGSGLYFDQTIIGEIDLRECIYKNIYPTNFTFWIGKMPKYNQQHFKKIEKILRQDGMYGDADDAYYQRKCFESKRIKKKLSFNFMIDSIYRYIIGYGVNFYYPIIWIFLLLVLGTGIFHLEGAVELKPDIHLPAIMSWSEAIWICLKIILPIEIYSGTDWNVSSNIIPLIGIKFTTFATILKLIALSLISLFVAGYSGLLKRWDLSMDGD